MSIQNTYRLSKPLGWMFSVRGIPSLSIIIFSLLSGKSDLLAWFLVAAARRGRRNNCGCGEVIAGVSDI